MSKLERLAEATDLTRLDVSLKNVERTVGTMIELMKGGTVPSSEQLKALWLVHEKLGEAYDLAEKVRVKK